MRGTKARVLLEAIGERELPLIHNAFDQLPDSRAVDHLRVLLTDHRMMPDRGNEPLVRFQQWLSTRIADLPDDGTSQLIERFHEAPTAEITEGSDSAVRYHEQQRS